MQVPTPTGAEVLPGYGDAVTLNPPAVHGAITKLIDGS